MAKAKYTPDKNGWYSTLVWDGTYDRYGRKHRKQLRTKKSSKELERMVNEFRTLVESRELTVKSTYTVNALLGCHDPALSCCREIARISVMECSL